MSSAAPTEPPIDTTKLAVPIDGKVKPVQIWATIGGALLALQIYVWIRWISGPYFERVPGGVNEPPMYMKIPLIANAVPRSTSTSACML